MFYQLWWNVFLHQPTWNPTHVTEILMDDTIFWHAIHLPSDKISPAPSTFPPPGLSQPLFLILSSLPSPSFIPGDIVWSGLDFTACKPNTESREGNDEGARKRGSAAREAHKQTDNWVWWCHSRLLAHYFSLSFFLPFLLLLCTSPLEGKLNIRLHVGMLEWRGAQWKNLRADWKLSKVTIPCKTTQHIHSKPEHKTELFVFPLLCHRLNSLRMITQSQKSCCNVAPMCLCCSVR